MIYIDADFCCHTSNPDGVFRAFEVPFFDGKCDTFIEGYRYVPKGENWTRSDGVVFAGEMIAPAKDYNVLRAVQKEYEKNAAELSDMKAALNLLGVTLDE